MEEQNLVRWQGGRFEYKDYSGLWNPIYLEEAEEIVRLSNTVSVLESKIDYLEHQIYLIDQFLNIGVDVSEYL